MNGKKEKIVSIILKDGRLTYGVIDENGYLVSIFMLSTRAKSPEEKDRRLRKRVDKIIDDGGKMFFDNLNSEFF